MDASLLQVTTRRSVRALISYCLIPSLMWPYFVGMWICVVNH